MSPEEFEDRLTALRPRLHRYCARMTGSTFDGEDVLQDTLVKALDIEGLSLHGLRRSFKSLTERLEMPAGVVAQIMGHKPSATAEKHYTVRPLDLLRVHHERIEAWILEQAGIRFVPDAEPGKLRAVT